MLTAQSNYTTSRATYRQVIGIEPGHLRRQARLIGFRRGYCPKAVREARGNHPAVTTAMFNVDAATLQVKIGGTSLYPTLNVVGSAQKSYGSASSLAILESSPLPWSGR